MEKFLCLLGFLTCYASASVFREEIMNHKKWELIPTTNCGIIKYPNRIINGDHAKLGQFPWMAQLFVTKKNSDQFICGGALINQHYVVTAAHCIRGNEKRIKRVKLGENMVNGRSFCVSCLPKTYKVENITIHPEYNEADFHNDIALIRLDEPVEYNMFTRPICLPMDDVLDEQFIAEKVDIAGWGLDSSEEYSSFLKYVRLPIRDRCVCNDVYERKLHKGQLCAGVPSGGDSCEGDSGGPMVWSRKEAFVNRHYIIGVVSFGKLDCGEGPAVYTNVPYYMKWILDNIYDEESLSPELESSPDEVETLESTQTWESLESPSVTDINDNVIDHNYLNNLPNLLKRHAMS